MTVQKQIPTVYEPLNFGEKCNQCLLRGISSTFNQVFINSVYFHWLLHRTTSSATEDIAQGLPMIFWERKNSLDHVLYTSLWLSRFQVTLKSFPKSCTSISNFSSEDLVYTICPNSDLLPQETMKLNNCL